MRRVKIRSCPYESYNSAISSSETSGIASMTEYKSYSVVKNRNRTGIETSQIVTQARGNGLIIALTR